MATLSNYPLVSQLSTIRPNPDPKPNAQQDCVEGSVGSGILWYQHKMQWDSQINPDALKNAAYGLNYTGPTAASRLVPFCQSLGYKLYPMNGTNAELVQQAHKLIQSNQPAIFTEKDPYSTNPNDSHVCVWFSESPGSLTALDPYIAQALTRTDAVWESLMLFGQIWTLVPISPQPSQGDLPMLQLTDPMGHFFTQVSDTHWHCTPTNVDLIYGHLTFYRQYGGIFGLPRTNEIYLSSLPGTAIMVYERAIAMYDPQHTNDNPPGSGSVYLMHLDNGGIGQQLVAKPLLAALQAEVTQLQAELAQGATAQLQAQLASYQAAVKQVDALVHPLAVA